MTEMAIRQYEQMRLWTEQVWLHSGGKIPLGAAHEASGYLEACITNMHRVVQATRALRKNAALPSEFKEKFPKHLGFLRSENRISGVRDAVQHTLDKIAKGEIAEGRPLSLTPNGPDKTEDGQFQKTISYAEIGQLTVQFSELANWLEEMARCAQVVADFSPQGVPTSGPVANLGRGPKPRNRS